jgi:antitoxin Phd
MGTWQLQQAKAKFSEVIDLAQTDGPQIITRRGVETAVILPIDEWQRLKPGSNESLFKALQAGSHFDIPIPKRGQHKHRKPVKF